MFGTEIRPDIEHPSSGVPLLTYLSEGTMQARVTRVTLLVNVIRLVR